MRSLLFAATALLFSRSALAQPSVEACTAAYTAGQERKLEEKWLEALQQFETCAQSSCPQVVINDCATWRDEVLTKVSLTMPVVQAEDGKAVGGVRVWIDGVERPTQGSSPTALEPGPHEFRFEAEGYETTIVSVELRAGEKRPVVGIMKRRAAPVAPPRAVATAPSSEAQPSLPGQRESSIRIDGPGVAFAGLGVAGFAGALAFGLSAKADYENLERTCAPSCSESATSSVRNRLLLANVSAAVGVVASATAVYFVFLRGKKTTAAVELSPDTRTAARVRLNF